MQKYKKSGLWSPNRPLYVSVTRTEATFSTGAGRVAVVFME